MFKLIDVFSGKDYGAFAKAWDGTAPGNLTMVESEKPKEPSAESRARDTLADIAENKLRRPTLEKIRDAASRSIQDQAVGGIGRR